MAIQKEIWVNWIIQNLFKDNEFLVKAFNADQYVLQGKIVHIPNAGAKPVVYKNPTAYPLTAVQRADFDIVYPLDQYITQPTHIQDADKVELSYDKIESVLGEHMAEIRERIGDEAIYEWLKVQADATAITITRTTGALVNAHLPSSTGMRKRMVKEDLKKARTLLNKQNVSRSNRYALLSADMMDQLMDDSDLKSRDSSMELDMKGGVVARLYGFDLLERSDVAVYDNQATPVIKAVGAAGATDDNDVVMCWQQNAVERALGAVKFFEDENNPLYAGDVYNALIRFGGRNRRKDGKGIVAIVQDDSV